MSTVVCPRGEQPLSTLPMVIRRQVSIVTLACLAAVVLVAAIPASAGSLGRDKGAQNVQNVSDVTGGMHYLLVDDDLVLLQVNMDHDQMTTSLNTFNTENSGFGGQKEDVQVSSVNTGGQFDLNGVAVAQATGRMYETPGDILAVLNEGNGPVWQVTLFDLLTNFNTVVPLHTSFNPYGSVYTQMTTGNFVGNNLDDLLVFYASTHQDEAQWGLKVLAAADPKTEAPPTEGPELAGSTQPVPVTGSIVTGDFNGDGRDEIALLLTDYQTIVFYSVDPKTLAIRQVTSCKLRKAFVPGQSALAAGHFRSSVSNAELVAFGQRADESAGYSVVSVEIIPGQDGSFTANEANISPYKFADKHHSDGALAEAASILNWPQTTNQQIVLGTRVENLGYQSYIDIGSFDINFNFTLQSETHLTTANYVSLQSMRVGNFDNQCPIDDNQCGPPGSHNPALQIETFTLESGLLFFPQGEVRIWSITPPNPITHVTNWLKDLNHTTVSSSPLNTNFYGVLPGDIQGRSLRLGTPEVLRIPTQIQPDIVLGIPPMHIDWIRPNFQLDTNKFPGCGDPTVPCLFNLTVLPSLPAPGIGFSTSFNFTSTSNTQTQRTSTTSWGVSVKQTAGTSISWGDGVTEGNVKIQNSTQYAHNHNVAKTYDTYKGQTDSVSSTTGFADHIFYTERAMNVYYYPVLAASSCPKNDPDCSPKYPTYVEFSVPDQVQHADVDGTGQDWYQPVHEPGEVLSYPWDLNQLQDQFTNQVNPLTTPQCKITDTSSGYIQNAWSGVTKQSNSAGSTDSFSDDLSFSYSERAGVQGIDGASFNYNIDIGASTSLSTLNVNSSTLSASAGVEQFKPSFDSDIAQCCSYDFTGYIFGQKNVKNPAYQTLTLKDPQNNPVDIATSGPLFVGFLDDVTGENGCNAANAAWWQQVYNLPDVSLNHPERWQWNKSTQLAAFNPPDQSGDLSPLDQPFYHMKGFFITRPGEQDSSPNLASATAGDDLTLTARVYNYSLIATNSTALTHPATSIQVSFYGQLFCHSGSGTENSCINGTSTCPAGTLCGNSFPIGQTQIPSIPGYESSSTPNWTTASVDFPTAQFPHLTNTYLVFWVVVWMEDAQGNLVPEMPAHGLTADPRGMNLQQITDVPVEPYSNNVGMYPISAPFFLFPSTPSLGQSQDSGFLQSISLSADRHLLREHRTKLTATLQAGGAPVHSVTIAYYDGDPATNGQLLDMQRIAYMDPGQNYYHRAFYSPETCGVHQLYAWAWLDDTPGITAKFPVTVTIQPVDDVNALIASTKAADFTDVALRSRLLDLLNTALQAFEQNQAKIGSDAVSAYVQTVTAALGKGIAVERGQRLIGQANAILPCVPGPSIVPKSESGRAM